jgi:uncharacterized protein (TIGR02117 family)
MMMNSINYLNCVMLVFLMSGCTSSPAVIDSPQKYSATGDIKVYVVSHGWHTGLVLPSSHLMLDLPALKTRFPTAQYIEFGWGDKGFYQTKEITSGLTLRAIFWPTESVIHAVGINRNVNHYFSNSQIEALLLTEKELARLTKFIAGSFAKDRSKQLIPTKNGIYGDSQFYKAVGDYYLMNTCNKWTAKGLKSIGMDISTTFKLTSASVMDFVKAKAY